VITYLFLIIGSLIMFIPVLWLVMSSFKPVDALSERPPSLLPYWNETIVVPGYEKPLNLVDVRFADGTVKRMAQAGAPIGIEMPVIDPAQPDLPPVKVIMARGRERFVTFVRTINFSLANYTEAIRNFPFFNALRNSVVITLTATLVTLLVNSMAAFALSKYRFRGRTAMLFVILSTLMVPLAVIIIPVFFVIDRLGWSQNLLGVIIPPAATPTGVFLLRQYMLTIPDELLEAARMDGATEWRIYWRIILPLTAPALAVLAIFSIMWRWNDFLWPLIVLGGRQDLATLQLALNNFQGDLNSRWHLVIALTVLSMLPITFVFAFLQRYITSGIAATGVKG